MWGGSLVQESPRSSQPASLEYVPTKSKETTLRSSRVEGGDQLLRVIFWAPHAYLNSHTWCAHMHLLTCAKFWVLSPEVQMTLYIGSFDSELSRTHGFSCPLHILLWQPHPCHFVSFVGPTEFLISRMCDWLSEPLLWHPAAHCVLDVFPWALAYRPCILTQGFVPLPSQWVLLHLWEHLQCLIHICNDATMVSGAWCPGFLSTDVPEASTLCLSSHCWPGQRACLPVHSVLFLPLSLSDFSFLGYLKSFSFSSSATERAR